MTTTIMDIKKDVSIANDELQKAIKHINGYGDIFGRTHTLKMHDAFYSCNNDNDYDAFYAFCELEYNSFKTWANDEVIDIDRIMNYVGNSSHFVFCDDNGNEFYSINDYITGVLYDGLALGEDDFIDAINDDMTIDFDSLDISDVDALNGFLGYIIGELVDDIDRLTQDARKVYDYINTLKTNQIAIMNEYK